MGYLNNKKKVWILKIGVFDSGIGGLSLLHEAMTELPEEQFIFYADRAHVPYGEKTVEQIQGYMREVADFMVEKGVKAIVIACNTATSAGAEVLRREYDIPIIGMEPAVKKAVDDYGNKRILVAATPITVRGEKMQHLIERVDKDNLVDLIPLPKLVRFAESGIFEGKEVEDYLREAFGDRDFSQYDSFVLGCTHFNYFKKAIRSILPESIHFVDGNEGTVRRLRNELDKIGKLERNVQKVEYFNSGIDLTDSEREFFARCQVQVEEMLHIQ